MQAVFYQGRETIHTGLGAPVPPAAGQVQVRVAYCGICGTDLHIFHGKMDKRVHLPQIIGHEMSGTIAAVGEGVTDWHLGDRVTVRPLDYCGQCPACDAGQSHICMNLKFLGIDSPGAMQELWTIPAHTLHKLPDTLSLEQGALIEPISVACHDVRQGKVKEGDYVVVQGGGPIGIFIALVAREHGAKVLISEVNPFRLALVRDFGFEALNPQEERLAERVDAATDGAGADVVFEVSGAAASVEMMTKLPRTRGRVVMVAIHSESVPVNLFEVFWRELQLIGARLYEPQDFDEAIGLCASGRLPLDAMITNVRPLDETDSAIRELESGGKVMKLLVKCS
jgi:(R,R)-butanediol dehydrogenase/meso-butanediol dehydrogenase/diacetyl reductase